MQHPQVRKQDGRRFSPYVSPFRSRKGKGPTSTRPRLRQSKITTMESKVENLFNFNERESIDNLFNEVFKDLAECRRSLDLMRAGKASTPADEVLATGLVPKGEGGNVVRFPGSRITRPVPIYFPMATRLTATLTSRSSRLRKSGLDTAVPRIATGKCVIPATIPR